MAAAPPGAGLCNHRGADAGSGSRTRYLPASGFDIEKFFLSVPEFYDLQEGARGLERLGMWTSSTRTLTGDGEEAERVAVGLFSRDMFPVLGLTPLHGRWFTAEDDTPDAAPVMVLGHDLWQRRFGGDPQVVGRSLDVNGESTQVVGVMSQGFAFPGMAEAYLPLGIDRAAASGYGRGAHGWGVVGRRHAGVTQADLDAELALIGNRWAYPTGDSATTWITAVGVVPDQVNTRVDQAANPQVYLPAHQSGIPAYGFPRTYQVAVRSPLGPEAVTEAVRRAVADFDADLPLYDVTTLEETVTAAYADTRLVTTLLVLFASIALVLAAVGIYGVVSYSVAGRTREIGIRVALGAGRHAVTQMIVGEGVRPVLLGLLLGLTGAWFARELVASLLFGVSDNDPVTFIVLPLGLLLVGAAASLVPALRATRIAPTEALREE